MPRADAIFERVRKMCLRLPEVTEVRAYGHPNFRTGRRMFVAFEDYRGKPSIAFRLPLEQQRALLDDERFVLPPAGAAQGWICRTLEEVDWKELRALVLDSYRTCQVERPRRGPRPH